MKARILVIDDEDDIRKIIVRFLEKFGGYEIFQAVNGQEGIKMFGKYRPDIVITDLNMPRMRGEEVARYIKRDFQARTKIIALSTEPQLEKVAKAAGCDEFLKKPFHLSKLQEAVEKLFQDCGEILTCR